LADKPTAELPRCGWSNAGYRVAAVQGRLARVWLLGGALAIALRYDFAITLGTLIVAILTSGMNDYLTKPIDPTRLQQALAKALDANGRPPAAVSEPEILFDEAAMLRNADGDREFARDLIGVFVSSATESMEHLTVAVRGGQEATV